ncbi:TauD/TfdA family dioxygenase [Agromyces sp. NBRC 114283]|uniref:TauD/TfdA family dioxygenase n=1 Tax=Agromyces sp. NBRC 114283 TaxID=2994521 RepID=UPI0024A216B7|nr:TauD/TfdA family dioxygenase [Agromyces sp. NBRC 114283]GLU91293.1 hypothetical protein Agsp01_35480 [Agromyces sp. NBRC 114283]
MHLTKKWTLEADGVEVHHEQTRATERLESLGPRWGATVLEARDAGDLWSLSGRFGRGSFPWHTDGAVSSRPPRWMVLRCTVDESSTPTEFLSLPADLLPELSRTMVTMTGRDGRKQRFAVATPVGGGAYKIRWDPRIGRVDSGTLEARIEALPVTFRVPWTEGATVIVDNHRLLHRRPEVEAGKRRLLTREYIGGANVGL